MKTEMRRVLAREPYEKKIQKVEQLLRLVREFPRQLKVSPSDTGKIPPHVPVAVVLTKENSSGRSFNPRDAVAAAGSAAMFVQF